MKSKCKLAQELETPKESIYSNPSVLIEMAQAEVNQKQEPVGKRPGFLDKIPKITKE